MALRWAGFRGFETAAAYSAAACLLSCGGDTLCSAEHRCVTVLASGSNGLSGLSIDAKYAYFAADDTIERVPLDGGEPKTLAANQAGAHSLAVDGSHVYWATSTAIARIPKTGGEVETLDDVALHPEALAVDSNAVYWSSVGVSRLSLDDRQVTAIDTAAAGGSGLVSDGKNVYFGKTSADSTVAGVFSVPTTGLGRTAVASGNVGAGAHVAFDAARLYTTDCDAGAVLAAPLDDDSAKATVIASGQPCPLGIAVDDEFVYVANRGIQGTPGSVVKVPLGGGDPVPLAAVDGATDIVVAADRVYFTSNVSGASNGSGGAVLSVGKSGGAVTTLATEESGVDAIGLYQDNLYYWATDVGLVRVPANGGKADTVAPNGIAFGVAIRGAAAYWTTGGDSNAPGRVVRTSLETGAETTLSTPEGVVLSVTADDTDVYFASVAGVVTKVPVDGGDPQVLARVRECFGINAGPNGVYCGTLDGLTRIPFTGDTEVRLATDASVVDIAVDSRNVYFATAAPGGGTLAKTPLDGGKETTLVKDLRAPTALAVDDSYVYWTDGPGAGAVLKVPLNGGSRTTLATNQDQIPPSAIAVDATSVYFTNSVRGELVKVTPK